MARRFKLTVKSLRRTLKLIRVRFRRKVLLPIRHALKMRLARISGLLLFLKLKSKGYDYATMLTIVEQLSKDEETRFARYTSNMNLWKTLHGSWTCFCAEAIMLAGYNNAPNGKALLPDEQKRRLIKTMEEFKGKMLWAIEWLKIYQVDVSEAFTTQIAETRIEDLINTQKLTEFLSDTKDAISAIYQKIKQEYDDLRNDLNNI